MCGPVRCIIWPHWGCTWFEPGCEIVRHEIGVQGSPDVPFEELGGSADVQDYLGILRQRGESSAAHTEKYDFVVLLQHLAARDKL